MIQSKTESLKSPGIFRRGVNCWRIERADKVAVLIDCANYYETLHHVLSQAQHSIFILGWDIDSRISLLRKNKTEEKHHHRTLFNLIRKRALENPDLNIYLNKWDYSIFFLGEREPFGSLKWKFRTPDNVHFCADYKIPFGACHHQKIIVIDDEIAFCGGMDIALGRWDMRQHHIKSVKRKDPGGFFKPFGSNRHGPYHDIQMIVSGEVARSLGELARQRWEKASKSSAVPVREKMHQVTDLWPQNKKPDFENIDIAISRTFPKTKNIQTIREIESMYLDEIRQANTFIYIENQYLTSSKIAQALNQRLKEQPALRVLAVSSDKPKGIMEHKAMWTGRNTFSQAVLEGVCKSRFAVVYPVSQENGDQKTIHIHSKLMIVDDRFLHVGSANLNKRSMGFDTECDLIIEGNEKDHKVIGSIRNNLIREHTGRTERNINDIINSGAPLSDLLEYQSHSRQHLFPVDDSPYKDERLAWLARKFGDPDEAYILREISVKRIFLWMLAIAFFIVSFLFLRESDFFDIITQEQVSDFIKAARGSDFSLVYIIAIYIAAGAVFFPVTVLNLTTAVVFGPIHGFLLALSGSLASASMGFVAGKFLGQKPPSLFQPVLQRIKRLKKSTEIMGMTLIRFVPIAPFTLVNVAFGMAGITFVSYLIATFLGLLPGVLVKTILGSTLAELWKNPQPHLIALTIGGVLLWIFVIWGSQRLYYHYKEKIMS